MTNTLAEAIAFIKARGPFYLDGQCEKLVNNAGAFTHTYGLAILAMQASPVPLNTNYSQAPAGAIHYWTNVFGNWPGYGYCDAGHTMIGDGAGLLWGDSGAITTHYGLYAGSVSKADLEARKPWLRYAGWTPYHGPETLAGVSAASTGTTTALTNSRRKRTMYLNGTTAGNGYLTTDNGCTGLSGQEYTLFYRLLNADQSLSPLLSPSTGWPVQFNEIEQGLIDAAIARANDSGPQPPAAPTLTSAQLAAIGAAVPVPTFDPAPIIAAIQSGDTAILTAVSQVDENTLATFGLKRI